MATYVIGDVQGCYDTLMALLDKINYRPAQDQLWFVGDLVNRGPRSVDVLRYLRSQGERVTAVLGNHDLHLLGVHCGAANIKAGDTLDDVLNAPDVEELIDWLASRPLLHNQHGWTMVHAGLIPEWRVADAAQEARHFETLLRQPSTRRTLFARPSFPFALRALTTIRTCRLDGTLCRHKGAPESAPSSCLPWFLHPTRRSAGERIIFGHWAALGFRRGSDYVALDSGCVWGDSLTAFRLEDGAVFSEAAREQRLPSDDAETSE